MAYEETTCHGPAVQYPMYGSDIAYLLPGRLIRVEAPRKRVEGFDWERICQAHGSELALPPAKPSVVKRDAAGDTGLVQTEMPT